MIKEEYIEIIGHPRNKNYYSNLGYNIEIKKSCLIKTKDLSKGSMSKITTICENCRKESKNVFKDYWNYTKGFTEMYYCNSCKKIKSEKTNLEKWGFRNPMQNNQVKNKLKKSILDKYGVSWYSKTDEWLVKFKKTSLKKWGYDNPSKNTKVINDIRDKNIKMLKSNSFRENSKEKKQRNTWKRYAEKLPIEYSVISYDTDIFKIQHEDCNSLIEITKGLLYTRLKNNSIVCLKCNPIEIKRSSFEIEVGNFLKSMNINIEVGNRSLLNNLELDYYLPDYNLAIECNGLYWHNELFKSKKYHINKTKSCEKLGIKLLHIWEDDWLYKKDIIKSIVRNKLNLINNKIWSRNCLVKLVETKEYRDFLSKNHIQGYSSSSYNIGLYHNDELVSLMTFGWRRTNNKREFELIRFCNKLDYLVIGSASKLFKHFLLNNDVESITSYSDISLFSGLLYEKLGFEKVNLSEPNYFWVVNGLRRHRYNFSKRKLVKRGYDSNKTGVEIMNDLGYWRIFSTGQEKWIYYKKV
jgi:hypothetical protein